MWGSNSQKGDFTGSRMCARKLCARNQIPAIRPRPISSIRAATPTRTLSSRAQFIPARAGNTHPQLPRSPARPVHPRASGEHKSVSSSTFSCCGSSPRERGTPDARQTKHVHARFIPTRAGNTRLRNRCCNVRAVHPRASGEHLIDDIKGSVNGGSSPRERGTRSVRSASWLPYPVHPRASGEHPRLAAQVHHHLRFIPARAGNTDRERRRPTGRAVHPRASGEHVMRASPSICTAGSSPRERGTRPARCRASSASRFIPARAGNTAISV